MFGNTPDETLLLQRQVHRTPMIGMVPPDLSQPQTAFPSYYQPEVSTTAPCLSTQAAEA